MMTATKRTDCAEYGRTTQRALRPLKSCRKPRYRHFFAVQSRRPHVYSALAVQFTKRIDSKKYFMRNSFVRESESFLRHHHLKLLVLFFGVFGPLVVFGQLAEDVLEKEAFSFDRPVLIFMHSHATQAVDTVMVFITRIGSASVLVPLNILVFSLLLYRKRRTEALFWTLAVVGAATLNFIAKHAFARIRPDLWTSISPETTFSFPSGHAMNSMAVVTALVVLLWDTHWRNFMIVTGLCFILLVGSSRIYLGVHYPSDVLAAWSASFAWVVGLASFFKEKWSKYVPS